MGGCGGCGLGAEVGRRFWELLVEGGGRVDWKWVHWLGGGGRREVRRRAMGKGLRLGTRRCLVCLLLGEMGIKGHG